MSADDEAAAAFEEARRRIAAWSPGERLRLSRIQALDRLPDEIAELHELRELEISFTQIADLAPLQGLADLQSLDCSGTQVADLAPLQGLANLQILECSFTRVADLTPLQGLANLQILACWGTQVADLSPLHGLANLQTLACLGTRVANLAPLRGLANLRSLDCSDTQVADLAPLQGLANLRSLTCGGTQVDDLAPLRGLANLQSLACNSTSVADLAPLQDLPSLRQLKFSKCAIQRAPSALWDQASLDDVFCYRARLPDVPVEALSAEPDDNALPKIRAHLRDLGPSPTRMRDAKLMVLGNGRVGKTQLCRRLFDEPFEEAADSTHGIVVRPLPFDATPDGAPATLHVWDFGGQDIYHGTHALFLKARAIFLVAWTPAAEEAGEHVHDGVLFRNHLLPYWLSYVKTFGGTAAPLLVVQTRCDHGAVDAVPLDEPAAALLRGFETATTLHHSALTGKGHAALEEALADLYAQIDQPLIGPGRAKVKAQIEGMIAADAKRSPEEKQHRTLPRGEFERMCDEAGLISDPALFLRFLSDAGVVFHRPGMFGDAVILDQAWALEAIYAVFDRSATLPILRDAMSGRFTRSLLATLLWDRAGYTAGEEELFLSMMRACGICFEHRRAQPELGIEAEYVAPDLLPEAPHRGEWRDALGEHRRVRRHALLPAALVRSVIGAVGAQAGERARYWRTGVYLFERELGARAIVEQEMADDRAGAIVIRTQDGRAEELAKRLDQIVARCEARLDLQPVEVEGEPPRERAEPKDEEEPPLDVEAERPARELWYFSYAHASNTAHGGPVDAFCADAARSDRRILRDVDELRYGDSIQDFMRHELAAGDRVFVWLTDDYLRSPYCMVELFELWRRADGDAKRLSDQVRLVLDVPIRHETEKAAFARFWREQKEAIDEAARYVGRMEGAFAARRDAIHGFVSRTWEILDFIGNHKFKVYGGFDDLKRNELGHG
jgi:internalin A